MRKTTLGLLLAAGAMLPGIAAAQDAGQDRRPAGEQRHDDGGRPDRGAGPQAQQQRPAAPQAQPQAQAQRGNDRGGQRPFERGGPNQGGPGRPGGDRSYDQGRPQVAPGSGGYRPQGGYQGGYQRGPGYRPGPGEQGGPGYHPGPGNQGQFRGNGGGAWNRGWRGDNRYDWGGYRAQNRGAFHLPRYYAPGGWRYGYRRFSPGITLSAILFDRGYWIGDPYAYRLPPAYGPYRWVRYYNDALLVDVRSGYVVDTVYDIFW